MKKTYTIAQVLATPEGQYVSAEVFATLTRATPPRGKGPWTANLSDATGSIVGKFWGGDISHWEGKRIRLSGQGMQRKSYQNVPELSVGQKADVSFAGAPGTAAQEDEIPGMGNPRFASAINPHPGPQEHLRVTSQPARQNAPAASGTPVHGATVGGALARAVDIWLKTWEVGERNLWDARASAEVERITRDLVAIQQRIESGAPAEDQPPF